MIDPLCMCDDDCSAFDLLKMLCLTSIAWRHGTKNVLQMCLFFFPCRQYIVAPREILCRSVVVCMCNES